MNIRKLDQQSVLFLNYKKKTVLLEYKDIYILSTLHIYNYDI